MPSIRLIAVDLDGTLYDSDKRISERNLAALREAARRGVYVGRGHGAHLPFRHAHRRFHRQGTALHLLQRGRGGHERGQGFPQRPDDGGRGRAAGDGGR